MRQLVKKVNIPRLAAWLLVVLLLFAQVPVVSAAETGDCGEKLQWEFAGGTLTITGSGVMDNYSLETPAPWQSFAGQITHLVLPDGLVSIGNYAFYGCEVLGQVQLPATVTSVGDFAFRGCVKMTQLRLNENLKSIGESAFELCESLTAVRLPETLQRLAFHAFYRCKNLQTITVPESVTDMGMTVFGYCENLVTADIKANIQRLPDWTFYGCYKLSAIKLPDSLTGVDEFAFHWCDSLDIVYYRGPSENIPNITGDIQSGLETFPDNAIVDSEMSGGTYTEFETEGDNTVKDSLDVVQKNDSTIGTHIIQTVQNSGDKNLYVGSTIQMNATLENRNGWQDVVDQVTYILEHYPNSTVEVDVYVPDAGELDAGTLGSLAGMPVNVTVHGNQGSSWSVNTQTVDRNNLSGSYNLAYDVKPGEDAQREQCGGADVFQVRFKNDATLNSELVIQLQGAKKGDTAVLYQYDGDQLQQLQAGMVDEQGRAHFYVANVDNDTEYLVGINVPTADTTNVIIPSNMYQEFDITDTVEHIEFVVTGVKSTWGINLQQLTFIVVVAMVLLAVVIGGVLYILNKNKLRKGYVPEISEEMREKEE